MSNTAHIFAEIGDSLTHSTGWGTTAGVAPLTPILEHTGALMTSLNAASYRTRGIALGISGQTSAQIYTRRAYMIAQGTPVFATIYAGQNDTFGVGTVQAGATYIGGVATVPITAATGQYYSVGSYILIGGTSCTITGISTDTLTLTGLGGAPTNGTAVAMNTASNIAAIGNYLIANSCPRILVVGRHYDNTSGGDTVGLQKTANATQRTAQVAATATLNGAGGDAVYVDLYVAMSALINAGTYVQGDTKWHVGIQGSSTNIHLNAIGHAILSSSKLAAIQAKPSWLALLA